MVVNPTLAPPNRNFWSALFIAPVQVLFGASVLVLLWFSAREGWHGNFTVELGERLVSTGVFLLSSCIVAYLHLAIVAVPVMLLLKRRGSVTAVTCIISGFIIGFFAVITWATISRIIYHSVDVPITAQFPEILVVPMVLGVVGAAIGWRFWYLLAGRKAAA